MTDNESIKQTQFIKLEESEDYVDPLIENIHPITIKSAIDLSSEQMKRIVDAVRKITGEEFTHVYHIVNKKLLMGVSVNTESFYYEWSGLKMLEELELLLIEG